MPSFTEPGPIISAIQHALALVANPAQAIPMQAYMLNQFTFLGIRAEPRRKAVRAAWQPFSRSDLSSHHLLGLSAQLWHMQEREFQYAAIDLLQWNYKKFSPNDLPVVQELVENKSWWDTVDGLAGVVGDILLQHLTEQPLVQKVMDQWLAHPCLWVRRVAMLHQLGWKNSTDETRLFHYALTLAPETDFFIRKAIGWALRDYARTKPDVVRQFLKSHEAQFSGLTLREAGKHL
jgi:3-methyladenine DNA glycosylase AlkD